ncbi:MAG: hypothetical protein ACRD3W_12855, partial [Terriglobales bacterium]
LNEIELAEKLLQRAKTLEPDQARWSHELSHLYRLWGYSYEQEALSECERCIAINNNPMDHLREASNLPKLAFDAGFLQKAAEAANQVFVLAEEDKEGIFYAGAINSAHATLGLIVLREGDRKKASSHLLDSLKGVGSPERSFLFEPDRQLVGELYHAGERKAVLNYLDRLELIWHPGQVQFWKKKIAEGESPWTYYLPEKRKFTALSRLPRSAYNSGQYEKARSAAHEFLIVSDKYKDNDRHYGFGLHTAHVVLGQLALRDNDIEKAIEHLGQAAQVPEAERLVEDGPEFALAAELAKLGHNDEVLEFLKKCNRLWGESDDKFLLAEWSKDVSDGKQPANWANLFTSIVSIDES